MEYPYFTAPQPYQFLGLPPTPAHTSANSDDFSNSPPVRDHFHNIQSYSQSFLTPKQDAFEFQNFDAFNQHFNANGNGIQPKPPTPLSQHKPSISNSNHNYEMNNGDMNDDAMRRGSNSDDDDNMTPAQSRRKAQNRAA
jgi:AP-1-like transcription factor